MFAIILFLPDFASAYKLAEVKDMALIYQGGSQRPEWVEDELEPYVVHTYADGRKEWFFESYLFYEFKNGWATGFAPGYGEGPAQKKDWEWLLDRVFEKDKALDALDKCIEKNKAELGNPGFKHKIVLGIPSAYPNQTNWGSIDGKAMDFASPADRLTAEKWYIDRVMERFDAAGFSNISLVGFYWIEEHDSHSYNILNDVADYIHGKQKLFYWIPYWTAPGYNLWRRYGFDAAFLQPNHFFDETIGDSRLEDACRTANKFNMALELEFDYRALYDAPNSFYSRLESYIDYFEKFDVFEKSSIAYYSGTRALLDMTLSGAVEDKLVLDRIAGHVSERRSKWLGADKVLTDKNKVIVVGGIGEIYVSGNCSNVEIFTLDGMLVSREKGRTVVAPGIYIVHADGVSTKVIVK